MLLHPSALSHHQQPQEQAMFARMIQICSAFPLVCVLTASSSSVTLADNDGVVRVRSAYPIGETIERLKRTLPTKASGSSAKSINRSSPPRPE
jgi:hypothetical protein